ncbi:hypothetical protein L6R29_17445 [Myxococcota bacterium]|nr:hypothetical protein [Myxococcota bacterium]
MKGMGLRRGARQSVHVWIFGVLIGLALSVSHCQCVNVLPSDEKEASAADGGIEKAEAVGDAAQAESEPNAESPTEASEKAVEMGPEQEVVVEAAIEVQPEPKEQPAEGEEARPESQESLPEAVSPKIGDPCRSDADCGGSPMRCMKEGELPMFPFPSDSGSGPPGGYCTKACFIGGDACPPDAVCYVPGAASGACLKRCKENKDCRTSYRCEIVEMSDGGCMPPACALAEPKGSYKAVIQSGRVKSGAASCAATALAAGTRLGLFVSLNAGQIKLEFGSKPNSPLPVTWPLEGAWSGLRSPFTANSRNGDGLVQGSFTNACLFFGQLEVESGACRIEYEVSISLP